MQVVMALLVLAAALSAVPSFPGAEGWGAIATGGRGGRVVLVTNLDDAGPGSFRAAMCDTGKRIIVFRVSGVINLTSNPIDGFSKIYQTEANSNFTVAGQTSPGGITLIGGQRLLGSLSPGYGSTGPHNFVIRFLRVRCTRSADLDCGYSNWDAVEYSDADTFIFDHCDFSGGDDGTFDITSSKYYTVQWSTVTNSTYRCGDHGGTLTAYAPTHHISLHHNLWAHHQVRATLFHWDGVIAEDNAQIDYVNNVIYNMWDFALMISDGGEVHYNVMGNNFVEGPQKQYYLGENPQYCDHTLGGHIQNGASAIGFYADNRQMQDDGGVFPLDSSAVGGGLALARYDMPQATLLSSAEAFEQVVHRAGLWYQDSMDRRVEQEVRTRTGRHRNNVAPFVTEGPQPPLDTDSDGMPDFWEDAMALDKADASDAVADKDGDGYTNVEEFINDLALARLGQAFDNPVDPVPAEWKTNPLKKLTVSPWPIRLVRNDTVQLEAVKRYSYYDSIQPADMTELSWSVEPSGVAQVDAQGRIVGLEVADSGRVVCWLTSQPSVRDTAVLTVWPPADAYALAPTDDAMADWFNMPHNSGDSSIITIKTATTYNSSGGGWDVKRGFLKFDLSALPHDRPVLRAELSLYVTGQNLVVPFPMGLAQSDNNWGEDTLNWLTKFNLLPNSWKYDWRSEVNLGTFYVQPQNGRQIWDLTDIVQSKIAQDSLSFFLYKFKISDRWVSFASKDTAAQFRPGLRIVLDNSVDAEGSGQDGIRSSALSVSPNPFNPVTCIYLNRIDRGSQAFSLRLFNLQGQLVRDLTPDVAWKDAGRGVAYWNASGVGSGVYVVRLQMGKQVWRNRAVMLK